VEPLSGAPSQGGAWAGAHLHRGHARVGPPIHAPRLDKPCELALGQHRVHKIEPAETGWGGRLLCGAHGWASQGRAGMQDVQGKGGGGGPPIICPVNRHAAQTMRKGANNEQVREQACCQGSE